MTKLELQTEWWTVQWGMISPMHLPTQPHYTILHIVMCNDHKPLQKFINGENANNKVNRWLLELATYNITFKWISGACKSSWLFIMMGGCQRDTPVTSYASINMVETSTPDGPATCFPSKTLKPTDTIPHADVKSTSTSNTITVNASPPLMAARTLSN